MAARRRAGSRRPRRSRKAAARRALSVLRTLAGAALAPTSVATLLVAARSLGSLDAGGEAVKYFLGGLGGYAALYFFGLLRMRPAYVFAHELSHAIAAWMGGAKVLKFAVRSGSGHVDLSRSSVFIALAPYWVPLYAVLTVGIYRLTLWAGPVAYARETFLALMGVTLSFHFLHTVESLWNTHQGDLDEAGLMLSMALIILLNGCVLLVALKCLFPLSIFLAEELGRIREITLGFWGSVWDLTLARLR